jgi:hypothetical protein
LEGQLLAGASELPGAVAAAVVGQQGTHPDSVACKKLHGLMEESDGGFGLLVGQQTGEGHARVIVHGHMQGQQTGMLMLAAQAAIPTQRDLAESRHALDIHLFGRLHRRMDKVLVGRLERVIDANSWGFRVLLI